MTAEAQITQKGSLAVVGFGSGGTIDLYPPYGEMGPVLTPGAKEEWTTWPDELPGLLARDDVERHIGGNVFNNLAYLAMYYKDVRLASVIGEENDAVSGQIKARMAACGIANHSLEIIGYNPSVSKITRQAPGSDRIVYGRPGDPIAEYLSTEHIRASSEDAEVVVASSVNDAELIGRIFTTIPRSAFLTFSPSSTELRKASAELLDIMASRKPDLLSVNNGELARLLHMPASTKPEILVTQAGVYGQNVLCTLGVDGMLLRTSDGAITQVPAYRIPDKEVVDTLGTGDRATAAVTHGLLLGQKPEEILRHAAQTAAELTRYIGANGDIRPRMGSVALRGNLQQG